MKSNKNDGEVFSYDELEVGDLIVRHNYDFCISESSTKKAFIYLVIDKKHNQRWGIKRIVLHQTYREAEQIHQSFVEKDPYWIYKRLGGWSIEHFPGRRQHE